MGMGGDWKEMFRAACEGDVELLRFHVTNGVDVNYVHPEYLSTPLVACILAGQEPAAHFLLDHGAHATRFSELDGMSPLEAARSCSMDSVRVRLERLGPE